MVDEVKSKMQTWDRREHKGVIVVSKRNVRAHVCACTYMRVRSC